MTASNQGLLLLAPEPIPSSDVSASWPGELQFISKWGRWYFMMTCCYFSLVIDILVQPQRHDLEAQRCFTSAGLRKLRRKLEEARRDPRKADCEWKGLLANMETEKTIGTRTSFKIVMSSEAEGFNVSGLAQWSHTRCDQICCMCVCVCARVRGGIVKQNARSNVYLAHAEKSQVVSFQHETKLCSFQKSLSWCLCHDVSLSSLCKWRLSVTILYWSLSWMQLEHVKTRWMKLLSWIFLKKNNIKYWWHLQLVALLFWRLKGHISHIWNLFLQWKLDDFFTCWQSQTLIKCMYNFILTRNLFFVTWLHIETYVTLH